MRLWYKLAYRDRDLSQCICYAENTLAYCPKAEFTGQKSFATLGLGRKTNLIFFKTKGTNFGLLDAYSQTSWKSFFHNFLRINYFINFVVTKTCIRRIMLNIFMENPGKKISNI